MHSAIVAISLVGSAVQGPELLFRNKPQILHDAIFAIPDGAAATKIDLVRRGAVLDLTLECVKRETGESYNNMIV